jgi:hypothetical protein
LKSWRNSVKLIWQFVKSSSVNLIHCITN